MSCCGCSHRRAAASPRRGEGGGTCDLVGATRSGRGGPACDWCLTLGADRRPRRGRQELTRSRRATHNRAAARANESVNLRTANEW